MSSTTKPAITVTTIQQGTTWSVLANRSIGSLSLSIEPDGTLTGTAFGDQVTGFWDADRSTLTFMRNPSDRTNDRHQLYRAQGFTVQTATGSMEVLAGSYEAFAGTGARADANRFGWFAVRRSTTLDTNQPAPDQHLWERLRTVLPDEDAITIGVTGGHHYVAAANGHVGPLYLAKLPISPPGDEVWGNLFSKPLANVHGFVRTAPPAGGGMPYNELLFLRSTNHATSDGEDLQVYRGHAVQGSVATTGKLRTIHGWAGTFTALAGTGATPDRTEYGWFAIATSTTT
jgi:hypothetical protein